MVDAALGLLKVLGVVPVAAVAARWSSRSPGTREIVASPVYYIGGLGLYTLGYFAFGLAGGLSWLGDAGGSS